MQLKKQTTQRYGLSAGVLCDDEQTYRYFFKHIQAGIAG